MVHCLLVSSYLTWFELALEVSLIEPNLLLPDFSPAHLDVPRWRTSNLYHRSVVRNLEVEPPCRSSPDYSVPALLAIYLGPGLPTSLCQYPSNWTFSPGVWQKKTVLKGLGLPWWLSGKEPACNAGDLGLISGLGRFPPEKEISTHHSILAWEIPWTEGSGRLQSMRLQRVRHDRDNTFRVQFRTLDCKRTLVWKLQM